MIIDNIHQISNKNICNEKIIVEVETENQTELGNIHQGMVEKITGIFHLIHKNISSSCPVEALYLLPLITRKENKMLFIKTF